MAATPSAIATSAGAAETDEILVVVEPGERPAPEPVLEALRARLRAGYPGRTISVLAAEGGGSLAGPDGPAARPPASAEAAPARRLAAALREADRREARATVLVSAVGRDESVDWLRLLLDPILGGGFDFAAPAYRRERLAGLLHVAILHPLTRALWGRRLRPPAGGEGAFSLRLARALLADAAWRRDPAHAGSDAWLAAHVLGGPFRACQAWLGRRERDPAGAENPSHALARVVGPVFHEMERLPERWQRVERSEPVPSFGQAGALDGAPAPADAGALADAFRLGLRELGDLWALVLPPAALLALRRAAAAPSGELALRDELWARIVYDFAVAHSVRTVEPRQLLRSMTPLYLGWAAGFVNEVRALDGPATDARAEVLCQAFEREKPYAIARWRWPDAFSP